MAFVGCSCYLNGTVPNTYCHLTTGQCVCKDHVEGKQCNQCSHGYWNIDSGEGYMDCDCSSIGSNSSVMLHSNCFNDLFLSLQFTGQCNCRKGYDGKMVCAQCKDVHWGDGMSIGKGLNTITFNTKRSQQHINY